MIALGLGLALGAAVAIRLRAGAGSDRGIDRIPQVLEGRIEAQAAEIRRLADAARAQDASDERMTGELRAARRVLEALQIREEERQARDTEHAEVVRRLGVVLAGGAARGRAGENVLRDRLAELPPGLL